MSAIEHPVSCVEEAAIASRQLLTAKQTQIAPGKTRQGYRRQHWHHHADGPPAPLFPIG
jgi:hypothetical protein